MDLEDREHFKTIANQLVAPPIASRNGPNGASKSGGLDQASCLRLARTLFSCYRRDEAHDPEIYVSAVAAVLSEYPAAVVESVTDPRTGLASENKFLPNVAEVREACTKTAARMQRLSEPKRVVREFVPPPVLPGQITSTEFFKLVDQGKTKPRPIGAFERGGYLGPTT